MPRIRREIGLRESRESSRAPQALAALGDLDTQLMLAVREGNGEAAGTLVRRNFARVSGYIGRIIRNPRTVEDLTQDVFVSVLSQARDFEPRAKFTTWLYRVATNRALKFIRDAQVERQVPLNRETAGPHHAGDEPSHAISTDEIRQRVAASINELPANQRVALTLFEYEELPYEQIASVLDVTVEAVRALLTRARATLRESLGPLL